MQPRRAGGYSTLQIGLHWLIAMLVLFQLLFGESMSTVVDAKERGDTVSSSDAWLSSAHYWVGISILALIFVRLFVRLWQGAPPATGNNPRWMDAAASATHWLFYLLLFAVPVTGLLALYVSDTFGDIHALAKPAFIVLIGLHAIAALYHQFIVKDGTLRRMLVPTK